MALYATCMPLPSDTFHDKLFAYDQGDDADYDHDREEVLWLLLAALLSLRLRQQCDPGQRQRVTQCALARAGRACATFYKHRFVCSSQPSTTTGTTQVASFVSADGLGFATPQAKSSSALLAMRLETLPALGPHRHSSSSMPCWA